MGKILTSLLALQSIEHQLAQVRHRLRARKNAVAAQQRKIDKLRADCSALHTRAMDRRKNVDSLELDLKQREEQVAKQRAALNQTKTNKEYAALLTQINTLRADNSKLEEQILAAIQDVESVNAEAAKIDQEAAAEEARLAQLGQSTGDEIARLEQMLAELTEKRNAAAAEVGPEARAMFDRLAESYDGEAMAKIDNLAGGGAKPSDSFVCGGCYMSLNPEHVNALSVRDEVRTCDNCGRILYLEPQSQKSSLR